MRSRRALGIAIGTAIAAGVWALAGRLLPNGLPAGIVVLGIVYGCLHALVAAGLVLTYRATRVVNFAQAELGVVAAIVGIELNLQWGVGWPAAIVAAAILGAAMGAAVDVLVMRRFADAPRLLAAVATIALAQVFAGLAVLIPLALPEPATFDTFTAPFRGRIHVGPVVLGGDHLAVVILAPLVIGGVAWLLQRTRYGLAIRAAADNPDRARLAGMPVRMLATIVWSGAGMLSAIAIVLRAPVVHFQGFASIAAGGPSLLLITLAAAVIGRMESLWRTATAAVALGVLAQAASWTFSSTAIMDAIVVAVILIVLSIRGRSGLSRYADAALGTWQAVRTVRPLSSQLARLPEVRALRAAGIGLPMIVIVGLPIVARPAQLEAAGLIAIWALLGVSLVVLTGWAGQISLGQFALAGYGSAATGILLQRHGWDLLPALGAGVLAAAAVSVLVGFPALRGRGPFLAVTTLGVALMSFVFVFDAQYFPWLIEPHIERPVLFGRVTIDSDGRMYLFAVAACALGAVAARNVHRSRFGRAMRAVRDNEDAAQAAGIDAVRVKLGAFALSGALAGLAGGVYALHQYGFDTRAFGPEVSITVFAIAVIGGLGSIPGAVMGAVVVRGAELFLPGGWSLLATGAGLLGLLVLLPGGLAEAVYRLRDRIVGRIAVRRGIGPADATADVRPASDVEGSDEPASMLRCRNLSVARDRTRILFDVNLDVREGDILAVLGPNGSGKSTLLDGICGLATITGGSVVYDGRDITGRGAGERGIALAPGGRGVFPSLTIDENLRAAVWAMTQKQEAAIDEAYRRFPELRHFAGERAGNLSGGQQQMLTVAQAMATRPRLLLVDELFLGLSPAVAQRLAGVVREINAAGTTVVFVEQSLPAALRLASRAVFLEKGVVRFSGPARELETRTDLIRSVYLPAAKPAVRPPPNGEAILTATGLVKRYGGITVADGVDLTLRDGEILGVIGPNGAGKTSLLDLLSGLTQPDGGTIRMLGRSLDGLAPHARAQSGLARSFQDARLWPSLTVEEAIATALDRHVRIRAMFPALFRIPSIVASEADIARRTSEAIGELGLSEIRNRPVADLSTGSRRLVDLAAMIAAKPRVLLLDEPSAGLAHAETEALAPLLLKVRERTGCAMILVEHHLPLVSEVADSMIAMQTGTIIARGTPADVLKNPDVVASYLGPEKQRMRKRAKTASSR